MMKHSNDVTSFVRYLKVSSAISRNQSNFQVFIEFLDGSQKFLFFILMSQIYIVNQFRQRSSTDRIYADKLRKTGIFDKCIVEKIVKICGSIELYFEYLTACFACISIKTVHDKDDERYHNREYYGEQVKFGSGRHTNRHRHKHKSDVARLFHCITKTDNR